VALLVALDIHMDWGDGATPTHVAVELVTVALAGASAAVLWWRLQSARRLAQLLVGHLRVAHADAAQLRADVARFRTESQQHARGLGEAIDRQFQRWGLSPAEREVALLLVKGLSHKEAAEVRATSERTVRQQALAVYRKAGLAGRAELAAFFLEDLLLPAPAAAEATPPAEGH
jgi:DNA-binding NarL/FixJ family response regulator